MTKEHFRRLIENASEAIVIIAAEGTILYESPSVERVLGYKPDALKALELLQKADAAPDILVTDLIMPGMSGKELAERFKQRFAKTPILFMSGYTSGILRYKDIIQSGAHLLMKPFTPVALAQKVRETLDKKPVE